MFLVYDCASKILFILSLYYFCKYSVRATEMSAQGQSIFSFDPKGKVAAAYDALTKEVLTIEQKKSSRDAHCL